MLPLFAAEPSTEARIILVHKGDIVSVATQPFFTTVIELPKAEEIMTVTCGDKEYWTTDGAGSNIATVKPSDRTGAHGMTNVNLITVSGNVYSFLVRNLAKDPNGKTDLKLLIEQGDGDALAALKEKPKYIRADQVQDLERQINDAHQELAQAKTSAATKEVGAIRHDFTWDHDSKAARVFDVKAMYHDDKFTYIEANPQEAPTLYELLDGKDALVHYTLANGVYTVPKILDAGYLRLGKSKLEFKREKGQS